MNGADAKKMVDSLLSQTWGEGVPASFQYGTDGGGGEWMGQRVREVVPAKPLGAPGGEVSRRTLRMFVWTNLGVIGQDGRIVWLSRLNGVPMAGVLEKER